MSPDCRRASRRRRHPDILARELGYHRRCCRNPTRGAQSYPRTAMKNPNWFSHCAGWTASASGRPHTFALACLVIIVWAVTGPLFGFSDTWQLVINTGTTIVTFLMVFLIQNTQNRDSRAVQLKLDEL